MSRSLIDMPHWLLISGTGRNSGKTTMVCEIIKQMHNQRSVVAVKICPHFHPISNTAKVLLQKEQLIIIQEIDSTSDKDSARMLNAGALQSYFVMSDDMHLGRAVEFLTTVIPANSPVVCESGGLRRWINPGLYFILSREDSEKKDEIDDLMMLADRWIITTEAQRNFDIMKIDFKDKWILKEN